MKSDEKPAWHATGKPVGRYHRPLSAELTEIVRQFAETEGELTEDDIPDSTTAHEAPRPLAQARRATPEHGIRRSGEYLRIHVEGLKERCK